MPPEAAPVSLPASRLRRRWFTGVTLLLPLVVLIALELAARLIGWGEPRTLFVPDEDPGYWRTNEAFSRRFFPAAVARAPDPMKIERRKPSGVRRIVLLGGSAAQGVPAREYGMSRLLQVMLEEAHPEHRFEVHNLAMTAINSHVVRAMAKEVAALHPDAVLIYLGNNEVVGPFGPGSVLAPFSRYLWMVRASVALRATRVGQMVEHLVRWVPQGATGQDDWGGMEMFLHHQVSNQDPRLRTSVNHLQANLKAVRAALPPGTPLLLGTVAVNLRDCPPFASQVDKGEPGIPYHRPSGWPLTDRERTELEGFRNAHPEHAEAAWLMGMVAEERGEREEARRLWEEARDLDCLRFRADRAIVSALRELGRDGTGFTLVDHAASLGGDGSERWPVAGEEFFFEHVHFTFAGNYEVARNFFRALEQSWGLPARDLPSLERCAQRLAFTEEGLALQLETILSMLRRAPFTDQFGHLERVSHWRGMLARIDQNLSLEGMEDALLMLREAARDWPQDPWLRMRLAAVLITLNRAPEARPWLEEARARLPLCEDWLMLSGRARQAQGEWQEARKLFAEVLRTNPHSHQAWAETVQTWRQEGRLEKAEEMALERVGRWPRHPEWRVLLALVQTDRNRAGEAELHLRRALDLDPYHALARHLLRQRLMARGGEEALLDLDRALIARAPHHGEAHRALLDHSERVGDWVQAARHRQSLAESEPGIDNEYRWVGACVRAGLPAEAVAGLERMVRRYPEFLPARNDLAWILSTSLVPELRDPPRALHLIEAVLAGTERPSVFFVGTYAAALAANGRMQEAADAARRAASMASEEGRESLAEQWLRQAERISQGNPVVEE